MPKQITQDFVADVVQTGLAQSLSAYRPSELNEQARTFSTVRQGNATNALTKVRPKLGQNMELNPITGAATISQGNLSLSLPNYQEMLSGLKTSTYKLLDALTVLLTESGGKSPQVTLSLDAYMQKCGLKDRKEARKQVQADLEALFNLRLTYVGQRGSADFVDIRLCDMKGIKRGIIQFEFSAPFYQVLMHYPVMPYPDQLWRLNAKQNPNSYYLLRKIAEHKNMNVGKKNEDIIAVDTLLKVSPFIPSYEEVRQGGRQVDQRIIGPFERDMNALDETLCWEYCHKNGQPLTEEELQHFTYDRFIGQLIRVTWVRYPDQSERLQRRALQEKQALRRRKRR